MISGISYQSFLEEYFAVRHENCSSSCGSHTPRVTRRFNTNYGTQCLLQVLCCLNLHLTLILQVLSHVPDSVNTYKLVLYVK